MQFCYNPIALAKGIVLLGGIVCPLHGKSSGITFYIVHPLSIIEPHVQSAVHSRGIEITGKED